MTHFVLNARRLERFSLVNLIISGDATRIVDVLMFLIIKAFFLPPVVNIPISHV